jgi:glycosyl transferase, family 25
VETPGPFAWAGRRFTALPFARGQLSSGMRSLIIHMSASTARRPNADRLCNELPDAQLIEAVNGKDPAQAAAAQTRPGDLFRPTYPFPLRPAEIGVFLSHRRCWQKIIDEGWDHAMIVEDDLQVTPDRLSRALAMLENQPLQEMYVRLPPKARELPAKILASDGEMKLILPKRIGLQCCCQIVGRAAAARLLAASEVIDRPVDTFLQMHWTTQQPVHALLPNGNSEIAGQIGGSTIQKKTRTSSKPMRELKRGWYRTQVALRPQRP